MKILVKRNIVPGAHECIGSVFINGKYFCFSLEDQVRLLGVKVAGTTAIPEGIYQVIIDDSTRFKRPMPHILNVKGFSGVRIHKGNNEFNTEGCILVGMEAGRQSIWNCQPAFNGVFAALKAALDKKEYCSIEITHV
jgi:hypothetical protein